MGGYGQNKKFLRVLHKNIIVLGCITLMPVFLIKTISIGDYYEKINDIDDMLYISNDEHIFTLCCLGRRP